MSKNNLCTPTTRSLKENQHYYARIYLFYSNCFVVIVVMLWSLFNHLITYAITRSAAIDFLYVFICCLQPQLIKNYVQSIRKNGVAFKIKEKKIEFVGRIHRSIEIIETYLISCLRARKVHLFQLSQCAWIDMRLELK